MRSMVAANVVLAVIQNAALDAEIAANSDAIASNRQVLDLLRQREKLGAVGRSDVAAQEAALAAVEGTLPPLVRASAANQAALSILIGKAPGMPVFDSGGALPALEDLTLPADLPMALPADLLKTRPDVAAAAATLEGAAADVKVAMAARLPQLTLSATAGGTAEDFGRMFADGNPFWQLLGGLAAPIFHGGSLKRQQQAAEHALDAAKAGYRGTALQAFADVSNALTALSADATALSIAERGDAAASASFGFVKRQLQLGGVGTLQVLNASAVAQTARAQYVAAKAARLSDTVGLYVALGGGLQAPQGAAQPATLKP
jgi:NodT family efflux transporter outer membrane factor (OMF) lipoprotein